MSPEHKKTERPKAPNDHDPLAPPSPDTPDRPKNATDYPTDWIPASEVAERLGMKTQEVAASVGRLGLVREKVWFNHSRKWVYWLPRVRAVDEIRRAPKAPPNINERPTVLIPPPVPPAVDDAQRFRSKVVNLVEGLDLGLHDEAYVLGRLRQLVSARCAPCGAGSSRH